METWLWTTILLCTYGVFKEVRPSEPYLTEYLEGPWLNLTADEVNHEVYPVWTYSYLGFLIIVLLATDFVRYKPFLVIEGMAYVTTWCLLLWAKGLKAMQMMQLVYGIATSTEVAYFTYVYSLVSDEVYQKVTSYCRASLLFGRFLSGVLSQALISSGALTFRSLNYISFASVIMALLLSLLLPKPPRSIYSQRRKSQTLNPQESSWYGNFTAVLTFIGRELRKCYSDRDLLLWSLWWAFATCGNVQVGNYIQPLWEAISPTWYKETNATSGSTGAIYNGAVEATHTLLSSAAAMGIAYFSIQWARWSNILLAAFSLLDCGILILMAWTSRIWIAYVTYVIFRVSYQMMITVVSYQVAKNLSKDTYGLIFGMNTFVAILLQTILTLIFVDNVGLHLQPRKQFTMYGIYFGILSTLFAVMAVFRCLKCFSYSSGPGEDTMLTPEKLQKG